MNFNQLPFSLNCQRVWGYFIFLLHQSQSFPHLTTSFPVQALSFAIVFRLLTFLSETLYSDETLISMRCFFADRSNIRATKRPAEWPAERVSDLPSDQAAKRPTDPPTKRSIASPAHRTTVWTTHWPNDQLEDQLLTNSRPNRNRY